MGRHLTRSLDTLCLALEVASIAALAVFTPGCILDSSARGVRTVAYTCTATLRSDAGEIEEISSTQTRFGSQALLLQAGCLAIGSSAEVDGYWHELINSVVTVDPFFLERGAWCVGQAACSELADVPESAVCPDVLPEETLPVCRPEDRCLALDPPAVPEEPTFESYVQFRDVDVGSAGGPIFVTISNDTCGEVVQIVADGAIGGRDPEHFTTSINTCLPDNPDGHALAPGESCELGFTFSPEGHGSFGANSRFNRDGAERYGVALRGDGLGGMVEAPERICLGELAGPRVECAGGNGTAPVSVAVIHLGGQPVTIEEVHVGGGFRAEHSAPITLSAGGSMTIDMLWCEGGLGDVDDAGMMVIDTNGANSDGSGGVHVLLDRVAGGCP